jgi:hypothetical protein
MSYFDATLEAAPVAEQQTTPILPEDRFIFELVGFERADPDQWNKDGSIRWTFRVFDMDGHVFEFKDEPYDFYRKTGLTRDKRPNFNVGTMANDWAGALLGRDLGVDADFSVSELRGKKMSAMVVWERQKTDKTKWSVKLASLRHVPVAPIGTATRPAPTQVSANPSDEDVDRATVVTDIKQAIKSLKKLDPSRGAEAQQAFLDSDDAADADALRILLTSIQAAVQKAMDE